MVRRRLSLPFTDVKEENEVIADEEINNWNWKSYHEIDVKQNMWNGRYIHKINQSNYNAKIMPIFLDNYGGSADQLVIQKYWRRVRRQGVHRLGVYPIVVFICFRSDG